MTSISTLKPGYLVSLKTSIRGNISYKTQDLNAEQRGDGIVTRWETEKTVRDPAEHERAVKVRSNVSNIIRRECALSSFGLLCPADRFAKLEEAVESSRAMCDDFNRSAGVTRVSCYVLIGRVADNDVEAARAINSEMSELLANMQAGIERLDVKAVRDACLRVKAMESMLSPDVAERVGKAILVARAAARKIVAAGEGAAAEIDAATMRTLTEVRGAFLDLEEGEHLDATAPAGVAVDLLQTVESDPYRMVPLAESLPESLPVLENSTQNGSEKLEQGVPPASDPPGESDAPALPAAAIPPRVAFDFDMEAE